MRKGQRIVRGQGLAAYIESKIERVGDCWLWQGGTWPSGRGRAHWERRPRQAHKLAFELAGQIAPGFELLRLCHETRCVRPEHFESLPKWQAYVRANVMLDERGCWRWGQALLSNGYGYAKGEVGKARRLAHRLSYEAFVGAIPEGLQIDHLCRVRDCVNPAHLEPVTCRINVLRGEGITARNAAVTHCPKGHAYTVENTKKERNGSRKCRQCVAAYQKVYQRGYYLRRRAAAAMVKVGLL